MGINLADIVISEPRTLEDFSGKILAIDAFNTLYQFLAIIRQPDGTPLMDHQGRVTSHLSGIIYRVSNFVAAGIKPAFVFDGEPPRLKARTIVARGEIKRRAEREEPRDHRSPEAASEGRLRGCATGGDLSRGHVGEPGHHARTTRRHGLADRDGLQRGRERNRAEEGARAGQETRVPRTGPRRAWRRDRIEGRSPRDLSASQSNRGRGGRVQRPRQGRRSAHALRRSRLLTRSHRCGVGKVRSRTIGTEATVARRMVVTVRRPGGEGRQRRLSGINSRGPRSIMFSWGGS